MKRIIYTALVSTAILFAVDLPDIENDTSKKTESKSFEQIKKEMMDERPINLRNILKDDYYLTKNGILISKDESNKTNKLLLKIEKSRLKEVSSKEVKDLKYEGYYKKEIYIDGHTSLIMARYNNLDKYLNIIDSRNITILNGEVIEDTHCTTTSIPRKPPKRALVGYKSPNTVLSCENGVEFISSYEIKKGKKPELKIISFTEREVSKNANDIITKINLTILNDEVININIKIDSDNSVIKTVKNNEKNNYSTNTL